MRYEIRHPTLVGKTIGHYEINQMPGCATVCVFGHAYIMPEHRGRGYGKNAHKDRLAHAKRLGYTLALCTVSRENRKQRHILSANGWCESVGFDNEETNNELILYWRTLE